MPLWAADETISKPFSELAGPHKVKRLSKYFDQLSNSEIPPPIPKELKVAHFPSTLISPRVKDSSHLKSKITETDILFSWLNIQEHPLASNPIIPVMIFDRGCVGLEKLSHVIIEDQAGVKEFETASAKFYSVLKLQYKDTHDKHGTRVTQILQQVYQGPVFYTDFHQYHFNRIIQWMQLSVKSTSPLEINGIQFTAQEIDDFSKKFISFSQDHYEKMLDYVDQIHAPIISISLSYAHIGGPNFIIDLINRGKVVVLAAGNKRTCSTDLEGHTQIINATRNAPGRLILTGSSKLADIFVLYSEFSLEFDDTTAQCGLLAPGLNVFLNKKIKAKKSYSLEKSKYLDGTSYSAPLTAGIIANLVASFPQISPPTIADIILKTAQKRDFWGRTLDVITYGQGILDYDAAYQECLRMVTCNT